jgi:PKD repeat protein
MKAVKLGIFSIMAMFFGFNLSAQTMEWLWAQKAVGWGYDYGWSIAMDNSGNSYVTGSFSNSATFGSTALTGSGNNDIFVAKMDSNGNWIWAKKAGGSGTDSGNGIAVDNSGNSYVTGYFQDTASFGTTTLTNSGSRDIFVAKIDSSGNWLWAQKADGSSDDYGQDIAVDNFGNSYVTGYYQGTTVFGSTTLTGSWNNDIFVAKLDSTGNWLWAKKAGGSSHDYGYSIAVDNSGHSYVTGSFRGTAGFGSTTLTSSGGNDIFVAKLDSNGNWLWAKKAGGSSDDYGRSIAIDNSGNSYVTGYFPGTAGFGSTTLTSSGGNDIFVAKLDSSGNWLWAKKAGGSSSDYGQDIAVDNFGNSYVTGYFSGTAGFGSTTLICSGNSDIFVAKLDNTGNWFWAVRAGGSEWADGFGYGIALDNSGNSYVTGDFTGSVSFGSTTITGSQDIFVAKIGEPSLRVLAPNGGEVWRGSSLQTVYWDAACFPNPINIKLSSNAGASWINLNSEPLAGTLRRYSFPVPVLNSAQCLIRIESAQLADQYSDVSDDFFTITTANPPSVALLSPDSPALKLQSGRDYPIAWLANQVNTVDIDLSYDWGVNWHSIATNLPATSATYSWTLPDSISTTCYLRIRDSNNPATYDWSDQPFTICKLELNLQAENEIWVEGTTKSISWSSAYITYVRLEYSSDAGVSWHSIGDWIPNYGPYYGSYNWQIPPLDSEQCKLRVSDTEYPSIFDELEGTIIIRPQIILSSPQGCESLLANSIHRILWDSTADVSQVVLDYSSNNGSTWSAIQATPYNAALGYYDWLVPAITTDQAKVRIRKYNENNITAISAGVFSIVSDPVAPIADFGASILSGLEPLDVQFTDLSTPGTGGITAWHWSFGDGGTSTEQNPLYTYNEPGIYSVSLRVEGIFELEDTELKEDYITVIASVPEIELLSASSINYGVVYLGDVSGAQSIEVKNIGGAPLNIETVSYQLGESPFALIDTPLPIVLAPDETAILNVTFAPLASGAVSDSIYIHSNADNMPVLAIGLRGTGEYVPPAAVTPPTVQILGNDAIITWEAVTETIYGSPITPDGYIVLYNETPYEDANYYYFLNFVPETSYTHTFVALFRPSMFYRVVAVKFYRESEREAVAGLRNGEDRITWKALKERMQGLHRKPRQ